MGLGQERREEKGRDIQLGHEDAAFYGHSKTDALVAHRNRRALMFIKIISNTDTVKTYLSLSLVIQNM